MLGFLKDETRDLAPLLEQELYTLSRPVIPKIV
jgi:hypothetical protein